MAPHIELLPADHPTAIRICGWPTDAATVAERSKIAWIGVNCGSKCSNGRLRN